MIPKPKKWGNSKVTFSSPIFKIDTLETNIKLVITINSTITTILAVAKHDRSV